MVTRGEMAVEIRGQKLMMSFVSRPSERSRIAKEGETAYQMIMTGSYKNSKTGQVRPGIVGHSFGHIRTNLDTMVGECINEALSRLGGTDWDLMYIERVGLRLIRMVGIEVI